MDSNADPSLVTLAKQAKDGCPLLLPWMPAAAHLGTSFESTRAQTTDPFLRATAFDARGLRESKLIYDSGDGGEGQFASATSSSSSSSMEHLSVGLTLTVGCSFLNVSVGGSYAKDVMQNDDAVKTSIRSSYLAGMILFSTPPPLSLTAMADLKIMGGRPKFRAKYGDYYVAGLQLGAHSAVMLSQSSDLKITSEKLAITLSVHVLWFTKSKTWDKVTTTTDSTAHYTVMGYDTLSNEHVNLSDSSPGMNEEHLREVCLRFSELGQNLAPRVEKMKQELGLKSGRPVRWDECDRICATGLVVGLLLMPFESLRDYVAWSTTRDII